MMPHDWAVAELPVKGRKRQRLFGQAKEKLSDGGLSQFVMVEFNGNELNIKPSAKIADQLEVKLESSSLTPIFSALKVELEIEEKRANTKSASADLPDGFKIYLGTCSVFRPTP